MLQDKGDGTFLNQSKAYVSHVPIDGNVPEHAALCWNKMHAFVDAPMHKRFQYEIDVTSH